MFRSTVILLFTVILLERLVLSLGNTVISPLYTGIITQHKEAEFQYQGQARSESDLAMCMSDGTKVAVCSIVHERFWQPPIVYRLCRCSYRQECPWQVSQKPNTTSSPAKIVIDPDELEFRSKLEDVYTRDHTMSLNNRSQLKFCRSVRRMPTCLPKKPALRIHMQTTSEFFPTSLPRHDLRLHLNNYSSINATVNCKCPHSHYWKYQRSIANDNGNVTVGASDFYTCNPLRRCRPREFCGHVSAESFATYYRCSCPEGHLCVTQHPRIPVNVSELFFNGTAYKAVCQLRWI